MSYYPSNCIVKAATNLYNLDVINIYRLRRSCYNSNTLQLRGECYLKRYAPVCYKMLDMEFASAFLILLFKKKKKKLTFSLTR